MLNLEYAAQIARDWNTKSDPYAGFVTRIEVEESYAGKFEIRTVGASIHKELWVPAEELDELNRHILGRIEIVAAYYGDGFRGELDPNSSLPFFV